MKFKNRIITAITIASVSFNLIFSFFVVRKEMGTEKDRLNSKINHYNTLLKSINTASLWDFDIEKIKTNLEIIYSDPEVLQIHLRDVTTTIDILMKKDDQVPESKQLKYELKILKENLILGQADIIYSSELYSRKLFNLIAEKFILTLGIIFINILAVYFISGHLLKPIDSVVNALKEIDSGNRDIRLSIQTGDEFGEIEKYFNKMVSTIQDEITVRIERENQLNDMHRYLSSIFDSIPSILISLDKSGAIRSINSAASEYSCLEPANILGKNVFEIFPLLKYLRDDIEMVLQSEKSMDIKNNYKSPDSDLQMEIAISSLYNGGITGAVIRMDDITIIKKKDEKLIQAQMMDSIGNLAGGIAHDFNNVLSGITGTVSLLKHRLSRNELEQEDLKKFLNVIDESGKRAVELTRQILSLSRKSEMSMEITDLNGILRHVYNFCFHSFDKSIDIQINYYPEAAMALIDSMRIEQVILNLCINAADAMILMRDKHEQTGGLLNISMARIRAGEHLFAGTAEPEPGVDYWKITVEDNGTGMDNSTLEKIFEPFFTTKSKGRGTGLGLAMAYNIIHMHNGFIDVASEPGSGSIFSVYIPASAGNGDVKNEQKNEVSSGKGGILIIDDEVSVSDMTKELLEYCGYEVTAECDPGKAVDTFKKMKTGLRCVIIDLNMPKKNGLEVLKEIRNESPEIKILISSGSFSDEKMATLSDAGASGFLIKPYTLENLADAVAYILT